MEFVPFDPWAPVRVSYGNLPHWQQKRRTYFVTWRMGDSIPVAVLKTWQHMRDLWLRAHEITLKQLAMLPPEKQREYHERFTVPWHSHLDAGHGSCLLRRKDVRLLVEGSLCYFDRDRYEMGDFALMPNHVHLLVTPTEEEDIEKLCFSWKRFSGGEINKLLGRRGEFWQTESYDHIVRSGEALSAIQNYIANNPAKAKLQEDYTLYQPESWHVHRGPEK